MTQDLSAPAGSGATEPKKKKGMHGCLLAFLIFLGLMIIGGAIAGYFIWKGISSMKDKFVEEYAPGYDSHTGQIIDFDDIQAGDHLYIAQTVDFKGDNDGNLAFVTQNTTLSGDVTGDVASMSQSMTIEESATIGSDLHFVGQSLVVRGWVDGKITGTAQSVTIREDLMDKIKITYQTMEMIPAEGLPSPHDVDSEASMDDDMSDEVDQLDESSKSMDESESY